MTTVLIAIALVGLLLPLLFRINADRLGHRLSWASHWIWAPASAAVILLALLSAGQDAGRWPMVTIRGGLLTVALFVSLGRALLRKQERMGAAMDILSWLVVLLLSASLMDSPAPAEAGVVTPWFAVHFALIFFGYGGMAISFVVSALFLVVRRRLKNKNLTGIGRLPPLDALDLLNFRSQSVGFVALSAGIAMGVFLVLESQGSRGAGGFTVWGTVAVWFWYAAGLHARLVLGWRGRMGAIFGVIGFGGLGVVLAIAGILVGGWHGAA